MVVVASLSTDLTEKSTQREVSVFWKVDTLF